MTAIGSSHRLRCHETTIFLLVAASQQTEQGRRQAEQDRQLTEQMRWLEERLAALEALLSKDPAPASDRP